MSQDLSERLLSSLPKIYFWIISPPSFFSSKNILIDGSPKIFFGQKIFFNGKETP